MRVAKCATLSLWLCVPLGLKGGGFELTLEKGLRVAITRKVQRYPLFNCLLLKY